jgi:hypothetical protein
MVVKWKPTAHKDFSYPSLEQLRNNDFKKNDYMFKDAFFDF